jgi:peptidoglycan/LPS O-acetylase OafA/YrhL
VLAVLSFHFGVPGAAGGYLGVDVFFVLSGFLITGLLLAELDRSGGIALRRFWGRRARRLLPGLCTMLLAVVVWTVAVRGASVGGDAVATLAYVANWRFVVAHQGYFAQFGPPSPLLHTWSLAIEEQFYLLWPLALLPVATRWGARGVRNLAVAGAALSAATCVALALTGAGTGRLYYGTDTRAQALLIGAAVAAAMALRGPGSRRTPRVAMAGACVLAWSFHALTGTGTALYRGGFTVVALAAAAVVAGVVARPHTPLARALAARPLRAVGYVSYELYLWHWPVLLAVTRARTGLGGAELLGARTALTSALAVASYALIDQPLRARARRALPRLAVPALAAVALTASVALVGVGGGAPPPPPPPPARLAAALRAPAPAAPAPPAPATGVQAPGAPPAGATAASAATAVAVVAAPTAAGAAPVATAPVRAVLLGDSVALTLGDGLLDRQAGSGVDVVDGGLIGCGVLGAGEVRVAGEATMETAGCANWETGWRDLVGQVRPAVVAILVGRWEVVDRVVDGRWSHIGEPAFDALLSAQLDRAIAAAASTGARVVLLTSPYFAGVERPDGGSWPEDDPSRVDRFNSLLRAATARAAADATVFDLGALADPDGRYTAVLDGLTIRRTDGVHFTQAGADLLAPAVLNALAGPGAAAGP